MVTDDNLYYEEFADRYFDFTFNSSLLSKEIIIDERGSENMGEDDMNISCSTPPPNLLSIKIKPDNLNIIFIWLNNFNAKTHLYYGCFGDSDCSTYDEKLWLHLFDVSCTLYVDNINYFGDTTSKVNIQQATTLSINSINMLTLNGYYVILQSSTLDKITVNSIIDDGTISIESDCDMHSSFIPPIYSKANFYLLNESVEINCIYITSDYVPIIVTSNVNSFDLHEINVQNSSDYLYNGLLIIEESSSNLTFDLMPTSSYSSSILLMLQKTEQLFQI
ncbi:hypothetical protein QTN25_005379 [Entamoeba marina]